MFKTAGPITLALLLSLIAYPAIAQCIKDPREVALTHDSIQIRAYACRKGGTSMRAEFHRFGASTAGLLTSGGSSATLTKLIGSPRIFRGDVVAVLDDIFARFGNTVETQHTEPSFEAVVPGGGAAYQRDTATGVSEIRQVTGNYEFPNVADMKALDRGSVPSTLSRQPAADTDYQNLAPGDVLWRFLIQEDLDEYEAYRAEYNRIYAPRKFRRSLITNPTIELMRYLAEPGGLPHDFDVIRGFRIDARLADESGGCMAAGWSFFLLGRAMIMDAVILENTSSAPVTVTSLRGARSTGGLRLPPRAGNSPSDILDVNIGLERGERILIPTRIVFGPSDTLRPYSTTSYVFGPALDVTGVVVDGQTIDFDERSANFMQISLFNEVGSCPYLLSWKEESQDWMQYGKILHAAKGADREYREIIEYDGLRTRFRLEEREPEIAYIDEASLIIDLDDGSKLKLHPSEAALAERDDQRIVLVWGEGVDFAFSLPEEIEESQVRRSELHVTGYYERYAPELLTARRQAAIPISANPPYETPICSQVSGRAVWPDVESLGQATQLRTR